MRKALQLFTVVLLMAMVAACTLFKKDIEVPQAFSMKINQSASDNLEFSETKTITTKNADIEKYQDDIDVFRVDKVTYKVTQFSGTNTPVVTGALKFAADGNNNFKTLGSISNLDLKAAFAAGTESEMTIASESVRNELISLIKSGTSITIRLDAASTNNPVDATIEFKIYANMTVEI